MRREKFLERRENYGDKAQRRGIKVIRNRSNRASNRWSIYSAFSVCVPENSWRTCAEVLYLSAKSAVRAHKTAENSPVSRYHTGIIRQNNCRLWISQYFLGSYRIHTINSLSVIPYTPLRCLVTCSLNSEGYCWARNGNGKCLITFQSRWVSNISPAAPPAARFVSSLRNSYELLHTSEWKLIF